MKFKSIYVWFALPVVLVVLWITLFYLPLTANIAKTEKETLTLRQESARTENQISIVLNLKKRDVRMRQLLADISKQIPMLASFPDVMLSVAKTARKEGLFLQDFSTMPLVEASGRQVSLVTPVIEIGVKGRFLDLGRFVENLGRTGAFKGITKASVVVSEKEYPFVSAKVAAEFRAWKEKDSEGK